MQLKLAVSCALTALLHEIVLMGGRSLNFPLPGREGFFGKIWTCHEISLHLYFAVDQPVLGMEFRGKNITSLIESTSRWLYLLNPFIDVENVKNRCTLEAQSPNSCE